MTISTKAPWFLFSTFVVMMLAVSTAMIAEDVGRSGTVRNARETDSNHQHAEVRVLQLGKMAKKPQQQLQLQLKRLMHQNVKAFLSEQIPLVSKQTQYKQYAALWKLNTPIQQLTMKNYIYSPPFKIDGDIYSPKVSTQGQNWITARAYFKKGVDKDAKGTTIHTEPTIKEQILEGALTTDENGKSFLMHSYYSICEVCAYEMCEIFKLLQEVGVTEGLITYEELFGNYGKSIEILKKCGISMEKYEKD